MQRSCRGCGTCCLTDLCCKSELGDLSVLKSVSWGGTCPPAPHYHYLFHSAPSLLLLLLLYVVVDNHQFLNYLLTWKFNIEAAKGACWHAALWHFRTSELRLNAKVSLKVLLPPAPLDVPCVLWSMWEWSWSSRDNHHVINSQWNMREKTSKIFLHYWSCTLNSPGWCWAMRVCHWPVSSSVVCCSGAAVQVAAGCTATHQFRRQQQTKQHHQQVDNRTYWAWTHTLLTCPLSVRRLCLQSSRWQQSEDAEDVRRLPGAPGWYLQLITADHIGSSLLSFSSWSSQVWRHWSPDRAKQQKTSRSSETITGTTFWHQTGITTSIYTDKQTDIHRYTHPYIQIHMPIYTQIHTPIYTGTHTNITPWH